MKRSQELLLFVLESTQMSQSKIRSMLQASMHPALRCMLEKQLHEYYVIEIEAYTTASQRGWDLPDKNTAYFYFSNIKAHLKVHRTSKNSTIAKKMIQINKINSITKFEDLHLLQNLDPQVYILLQRFSDCQIASIRLMKNFL